MANNHRRNGSVLLGKNSQYCICNRCNGTVLLGRTQRKKHKNEFGIATVFPERLVPGAPDDADNGASEDEEEARERANRDSILRNICERSDDEDLDEFSPLSTPPLSQHDGEEQEEERPPRIEGGFAGEDDAMSTEPGLLAKGLELDEIRFKFDDWINGVPSALLISAWLMAYAVCIPYGVAHKSVICYAATNTHILRLCVQRDQ